MPENLIHVTEALRIVGLVDCDWADEWAMDRGTAVHQALALDATGELDDTSLDPRIAGYIAAGRKFFREVNPEILAVEESIEHPTMGYCGRLDYRIMLHGPGTEAVLDVKTGGPASWHPYQLAGYALGFSRPMKRFALYLSGEGKYKLQEFKDRGDFERFKAIITVAYILREQGKEIKSGNGKR